MAPAQDTKRLVEISSSTEDSLAKPIKKMKCGISSIKQEELDSNYIINEIFYKGLLENESVESLSKEFFESKPYLHCKIDQLVNEDLLRKVREEIMNNLHFSQKETDIYRVNQTGDLANLDGLDSEELNKLGNLKRLRDGLYSKTFRDFISHITHCGPLSGENADMSINNYTSGCHLLNHDDVIGTRRVSYILYLPGPNEEWEASYGGALELYPVDYPGAPVSEPSVSIPPKWNQMVFFTVQPGHSFHSVEEVIKKDKDRLSISGWFHIPNEGEEGYVDQKYDDKSIDSKATPSAKQLEIDEEIDYKFKEKDIEPMINNNNDDDDLIPISEENMKILEKYISPIYLDIASIEQMLNKFIDESSIQLGDFLKPEYAEKLSLLMNQSDKDDGMINRDEMTKHGSGLISPWKIRGPAHKWRYGYTKYDSEIEENSNSSSTKELGITLQEIMKELFESGAFASYISLITGLITINHRGMARRFRPGLDYTLATANQSLKILDTTLSFSGMAETFKNKEGKLKFIANEDWETEEYGGYYCYMAPYSGDDDPAVYRQMDEDGALLTLACGFNVLTIVLCDVGLMKFTKYISARAPGSLWDISYEYKVPEDEDEEEEEEKKEVSK